jgi:hypothetical protein
MCLFLVGAKHTSRMGLRAEDQCAPLLQPDCQPCRCILATDGPLAYVLPKSYGHGGMQVLKPGLKSCLAEKYDWNTAINVYLTNLTRGA